MGFTFQALGAWDQFGFGLTLARMRNPALRRVGIAIVIVFAFFEIRLIFDLWDTE